MGSAENAEPMQAAPAEGSEGGDEPPQEQEPPRAPEASMGSAENAEPMQAAPAEGSEGGDEAPHPEQELPQASLSCGHGGSGPRAAAEGEEITPPEAEPTPTLVSGAQKGGEELERAEGGALKADPLPEVQRGQETGPQGPVPVTEGAREEPLKQLPPRASLSGGGEGSGPRAAIGGETETVPVTDAEAGEGPERVYPLSLGEGGEGPERVDPLPSRAEDGPETAVQGSAVEAEPMEEAPTEGQKGGEKPERAEGALKVDPLLDIQETLEAGPECSIEGPAAAEVAEGAQEGPPTEHLSQAPPPSGSDTGPGLRGGGGRNSS
ncbi:UNVERIFIED_CONTAM: hypothetical protein FKN15_045546 [Acipenser sinensis]